MAMPAGAGEEVGMSTGAEAPGAAPTSRAERTLFVRQSSGLVREFSIWDVVLINVAGVNLGAVAALSIAAVAGLWPGASVLLVAVIGALVSLATVGTYGLMSAAMPRAGGDYVFVGRTLWPWLGFAANWMITWSLFVALGLFSVALVTQALAPGMAAFGYVAGSHWFVQAATDISSKKGLLFVIALAVICGSAAVALSGDKAVKWAFRILAIIGGVGLAIAVILLLVTSHGTWVGRIDPILTGAGGNSIAKMRAAADQHGFTAPGFSWSATFSALPYAFFVFVGLTYTSYLGGEIQKPQRSQPVGMLIALVAAALVYIVLFIGVYNTFGWDNIHAWAFLAGNDPTALSFFGGFASGTFLIGTLSGSPVISFILGLSFVAWFAMLPLFAIVMPIRNMFAWSMDRVIPEGVSRVSAKGTPIVATAICAILAVGVVIVAVYSTFLNLVVNYTLMYSITFLIAGLAALAFPYRRPDLFERAPASVRRKIAGVPIVSIAGAVETVVFAVIIVEALSNPAFGGPNGRNALLFIIGVLIAGPVLFFVSRAIRMRQGYDVDAAWRGLPPD
jgi:APA family basic amino acid/polyamine antiporter